MEQPAAATTAEKFDIAFEATADDFLGYIRHVSENGDFYREQMRRSRRLVLAIWLVGAALFAIVSRDPFIITTMFLIFGTAAAFSWFTWPKRWAKQVRKQGERQIAIENPLVFYGPKHYEIDAGSVRFVGQHNGGYVMWPAITRVTSDDAAAYLHISQASAHILPRRAFASIEEFRHFVARAQVWRAAASQAPVPSE